MLLALGLWQPLQGLLDAQHLLLQVYVLPPQAQCFSEPQPDWWERARAWGHGIGIVVAGLIALAEFGPSV